MSDLIDRLRMRSCINIPLGDTELLQEAADRIEALEQQLSEWREMTDITARDKRIELLEARVAQQVKLFYAAGQDAARLHERITELEAALQEIAVLAGPHRDVERLMERIAPELADYDKAMGELEKGVVDLAKGVIQMSDIARHALEGKP